MSECTMMSGDSLVTGLRLMDACQMSLPGLHHAEMPARRTSAEEVLTAPEPACSSTPCASSVNFKISRQDHVGLLLRTFLESEAEALTGCSMRWKHSATKAGRSWWVLVMSERGTSGSGCSSSAMRRWYLPTPTKSAATQGGRKGDRPTKEGKILRDLITQNLLPWPVPAGMPPTMALYFLAEWMMGFPKNWLGTGSLLTEIPSTLGSRE